MLADFVDAYIKENKPNTQPSETQETEVVEEDKTNSVKVTEEIEVMKEAEGGEMKETNTETKTTE